MRRYLNLLLCFLLTISVFSLACAQEVNLPEDLLKAGEFHGHICPGLAKAYMAVKVAQKYLQAGAEKLTPITPVVENKRCGLDAVQFLLKESSQFGNTYGNNVKGVIVLDYGKDVWIFIRDHDQKALRVALKPGVLDPVLNAAPAGYNQLVKKVKSKQASRDELREFNSVRLKKVSQIVNMPEDKLFTLRWLDKKEVDKLKAAFPKTTSKKRIRCNVCGEEVIEHYLREKDGQKMCMPCYEGLSW